MNIDDEEFKKLFDNSKDIEHAQNMAIDTLLNVITVEFESAHKDIIKHAMSCEKCGKLVRENAKKFMILLVSNSHSIHDHYHEVSE